MPSSSSGSSISQKSSPAMVLEPFSSALEAAAGGNGAVPGAAFCHDNHYLNSKWAITHKHLSKRTRKSQAISQ